MATDGAGRPLALITGASAGIGQAFAERLAADGYDLLVVARRREQLEELARRCRARGAAAEVLAADLTDPAQRRSVEERAATSKRLALLVNNAGFAAYQPFVEQAADAIEEQVQLHVIALTRLTRAALPGMIARGAGAIINVSSGLAFSAGMSGPFLPARVVYGATKAYVNSFTELLQGELAGTGVQVQALCPGRVRTEFFAKTGIDVDGFPPDTVMAPEDVVQAALAGLALGETICAPPLEDATVVTRSRESQHQVLANMRRSALAQRYIDTARSPA